MRNLVSLALVSLLLTGCATWSTTDVKQTSGTTTQQASTAPSGADVATTDAADILITEEDITDRAYESLGDISVTVNKTTIFHSDPTPEMVREKLREEAAELGADAVVLVRYGSVGVSLMSWGSLDGKGRAVRFVE